MRVIPTIISFDQTPYSITAAHMAAAVRMLTDASRILNRTTKMALRFSTDPLHLVAPFPLDASLALGVRTASTTAWWDSWRVLRHHGYDEAQDVYLVWLMTPNTADVSGVGQPAAPHQFDGDLDNIAPFDPDIGGIAVNGGGQLLRALSTSFKGTSYRYVVWYAVHELGHALGRHHTPDPVTGASNPNNAWNMSQSFMSYGYHAFAEGKSVAGHQPNPMLAIPAEIVTWRRHQAFVEIPERYTTTEPGWADDLILMKAEDASALFRALPASQRARLLSGALSSEIGTEF